MAIRVELQLADGQFVTRMMHAGETVRQFNDNLLRSYPALRQLAVGGNAVYTSLKKADDTSKGFLSTLRDLSIVAGVVAMGLHKIEQMSTGLLGSIVKVNSEFENMALLMKAMSSTGDRFSAEEQVKRLREEAAKAPFSLHALQDAATKLKATGFDPLNGSLNSLMDAVAAVGGGDEKLNRVTLAISQMAGKGVIQMEELRQQLGEALPMATELMARSMGLTISELIQKISTGTVAAKPALQGLFLEMDRTFGGSAERMMQTFSGQITKTTTLLQSLALRFGEMGAPSGAKTFYSVVKQQLTDLNNFLGSEFAGKMVDSFNTVLVDGLETVRGLVDKLISLRGVLSDVGEKAIWAFGIFMSGKLLSSVMGFFGQAVTGAKAYVAQLAAVQARLAEISVLQVYGGAGQNFAQIQQMRNLGAQMQNVMANSRITQMQSALSPTLMAGMTSSITATSVGMSGMAAAGSRVMAVLPLIGSTMMTLVGVLPLLGLGIYAVADYFDLFGNKAKNAWQELEHFGATSLQQIVDAQGLLDVLAQQIKDLEAQRDATQYSTGGQFAEDVTGDGQIENINAAIDEKRAQLAKLGADLARHRADAEAAEAERAKGLAIKGVQDSLEAKRIGYNEDQKNQREAYDKERSAAIAAHRDTEAIQVAHRAALMKIDMGFYDQQIEILRKAEADTKARIGSTTGVEQKGQTKALAWITEQLNTALQMKQQMEEQGVGLTQLVEPTNLEKALGKGETALQNIKKEAEGLKSQLQGGSREAGELAEVLQSGIYGPAENSRVAALIEELKQAQKETDALKDALDAMNEGQSLYDSTIRKLQEEHLDSVTKDMGVAEAYKVRQQAIVDGLSPQGKIALMMQDIRLQSDQARESVLSLATAFVQKLFGTETVNGGNTLLGMLDRMAQKVTGIVGSITSAQSSMGMSFVGGGSNYNLSNVSSAVDLIKKFEGFLSSPRWDVNAYRAGYGSDTFTAPNGDVTAIRPGMQVTLADADRDLFRRIGDFQKGIIDKVGADSWGKLDDQTQQALTSVAYNYGTLPNDIAKAVQSGSKDGIAQAILSHQGDNGGVNANRRAAEANYMMSGSTTPIKAEIYVKGPGGEMLSPEEQLANIKKELAVVYGDRATAFWKDIDDQLERVKGKTEEGSEAIAKLKQQIRAGYFGDSAEDRNPEAEKYKSWYVALEKVIAAEKKMKEQRQAGKDVDNGIEENTKRIQAQTRALQQADQEAQKNPYAKRNEDLQQIIDRYDILIEKAREANGGKVDSAAEKQLLAQKQAEIDLFNQKDVQATVNTLQLKEEALRDSLGTERQVRERELQRQLAELDAYATNFKGSKEQEAQVVAQVEATKSALIAQYGQQNEGVFASQMRQWADMSTNMQQVMAGAMSSIADGLTNMLMGEKVNWKNIIKDIVKDLVNTALRGMMSGMMGGKGQLGGLGGGKGGKAKMMAGVHHTGGIAGGSANVARAISPAHFIGAPRFHTGGIIGANEVPVIAQRGEGIFTPEQMKAMGSVGGARAMAVNTTVNVNSQGGDPKQNDDLAKKIAKEVEGSVRGIVFKEMREQMRPGNALAR